MAALSSGVKKHGALDLALFLLPEGSHVAGIFSLSDCASPAVTWCRHILPRSKHRAIIVNAGNANAYVAKSGEESLRLITEALSHKLAIARDSIFMASTGVIGVKLPTQTILSQLERLCATQEPHQEAWHHVAQAIMTTDTYPKGACATCAINGKTITLSGVAKGSGMIAPNMATMLAFIFTDADIPKGILQDMLCAHSETTFHAIDVDGDMSTSDTVLLTATHSVQTDHAYDTMHDPALQDFRKALHHVMHTLALHIVRDGEGAQKSIDIHVTSASSHVMARAIATHVARSPLVKTAIAGADPNWGRIIMAVGKARQNIKQDALSLTMCHIPIIQKGVCVLTPEQEKKLCHAMNGRHIPLHIDLNLGTESFTMWTCDLTHGYIDINADYRS